MDRFLARAGALPPMMFFEILRQMLRTLWAHKLRSFLTMFGIAWGVGSLLLLVGLGEGFRSGNRRELNSLGEDIMFVFPGRAPAVAGNMSSGRSYNLTDQDYRDILAEAPHVRAAAPVLSREDLREVSEYANTNGEVSGVPPHYNQIRYLPLAAGRWFNQDDETQKRLVAVVGDEMLKNLFPGRPAVGNAILLDGIRFEVIGVVERVGHGDNNSTNNRVFMPFSTMREYFPLIKDGQDRTRCRSSTTGRAFARACAGARRGPQDHRPQSQLRLARRRRLRRLGHHQELGNRRQNFRRDGSVPRRRRHRDPDAGCDRHHQHHAGGGQRAHPRDRIAQSPGRNQSQHPAAVFPGRSVSYTDERRHRHGRRRTVDVHDARHGRCGAGVRSAYACRSCRQRWRSERWRSPESSPEFIPRAKRQCCSRSTH